MAEEQTHGFDIDAGDHHQALDFIKNHMNKEQVEKMVHVAKGGHGFPFMVTHNGTKLGDYKLVFESGKLKIHHDVH